MDQKPDKDAAVTTSEGGARAEDFIAEFLRWREVRSISQKRLAAEMDYDASYISKIEHGHEPPTRGFAERADDALKTGGALLREWRAFETGREDKIARPSVNQLATPSEFSGVGLVVVSENAKLAYDDGLYRLSIRRKLRNEGETPVARYLIRVAVDRHPDKPEQSNELYRQRPLMIEELRLVALCEGEPMSTDVLHDRDAFKEIWLLFENEHGRFPLYPGQEVTIDYRYEVSADKWGKWLQRHIRHATNHLSVELDFPASSDPAVWGLETSMTAAGVPTHTPLSRAETGDRVHFSWSTNKPAEHTRYRFEWRFRGGGHEDELHLSPAERMAQIGVVQQGDPVLGRATQDFDLPGQAVEAQSVAKQLKDALVPIRSAHTFGKGVGLAAPQLGIRRSVAVVQMPDDAPLVLFNPRVIEASDERDEQYEGCLSLFNVRGVVRRALAIEVEHTALDGNTQIAVFERGAARLWAHEIDHLSGVLYVERMEGREVVPVSRYESVGEPWNYQD